MREMEYNNFMNLSLEDKKFVISGLSKLELHFLRIQMITESPMIKCATCPLWDNEYHLKMGICNCKYSENYEKQVADYEGCYGEEIEYLYRLCWNLEHDLYS